jgi:hypothetical protein
MGKKRTLADDIARLDEIRNGMWQFQVERIEEKSEEDWAKGGYTDLQARPIMENLGKNTVQFTEALTMMSEKDIIKQGADMLNLVLMLIDKGTASDRVW